MRVTSADVAQRAGVSRATVSYVLNDAPGQTISAETREAVQRAARELGYRPNPGAKTLRSGRSDIVLFPLAGLETTHWSGLLINACSRILRTRRLTLVTDFTTYDTVDDRIDSWLRLGPAVVIDLIMQRNDPTHDVLKQAGVAVLSAGRFQRGPKTQSPIDALSDEAREVQVKHLLSKGHRDIVLAVPASVHAQHFPKGRQKGMHKAVADAQARMVIEDVDLDPDAISAAVEGWMKRKPRPHAICAYNDELAIALLSEFSRRGVKVPGDIAVMGVDDDPLSAVVVPSLSTVMVSLDDLSAQIANATMALMDSDDLEGSFEVPPLLAIERQSA